MIELSVVLVNHDGADCLPAALRALGENTRCEDVEAIVVDSASTDGSWEDVERHWPRARALRFAENIGFCRGCNRGAEAAGGRLVAFVNFDGEVEPGWDGPLTELLEDPTVWVATGLLLDAKGEMIEAAGLEISPNMATYGCDESLPRSAAPAAPVDVTAASGALMMMRREEFLALGGFYEPIWMYGEEADLCLRVPGRVMLHPGSAIRHAHGAAAGPPRSQTRLYLGSRNRLLNAARHLPAPALARAVLASAAFDTLTLTQVRSRSALAAVLTGWRDGLPLVRGERRSRSPEERRRAAARVGSLRAALAQQRRLGRLGGRSCSSPGRSRVPMPLNPILGLLPARLARRARTLQRAVLPDRVVSARMRIANRYLSGEGIEIGALHNPLPMPRSARVRYVDRLPVAELRVHYPELQQEPLVEVDVLDDGERLTTIADSSLDFVVANHFLEHTQDPLRTLVSAFRVLRPEGVLYLAVPDKRHTFDRDRPVTPFEHLLRDFDEGPAVSRRQHFEEWARLVDRVPDDEVTNRAEQLMEEDYSIHFHVWTQREALELLIAARERLDVDFVIELMERIEYEVVFVLRKGAG